MKKRIAILAAVLAALTVVPLVYAHGHGSGRASMHGEGEGMHGMHMFRELHRIAGELDLTEQQKTKIHAIMEGVHEQNAQYREQLHGRIKSVAEVLIANPQNVAQAQAILDAQPDAERALKANLVKAVAEALTVLTPEQRAKLGTIVDKHVAEMESRHGR